MTGDDLWPMLLLAVAVVLLLSSDGGISISISF